MARLNTRRSYLCNASDPRYRTCIHLSLPENSAIRQALTHHYMASRFYIPPLVKAVCSNPRQRLFNLLDACY